MSECDYGLAWYHGAQQELTELRLGSSITQNRILAKAFCNRNSAPNQESTRRHGEKPGHWPQTKPLNRPVTNSNIILSRP